jgi:tetratricopeptide (TPR) repeat protein
VKNDPKNGLAYYHLGLAFDQSGELAQAESAWQSAVGLRPDLTDGYRVLAGAAVRRGDLPALEQAAAQIVRLLPDSPDGYVLRASSLLGRGQFDRAQADIDKTIALAPQSSIGYQKLGELRLLQKNYPGAETSYRLALDRQPTSAEALDGLMQAYLGQKQTQKALTAARAQIAKVPGNSAFYDLLGSVLLRSGRTNTDLGAAESAFQQAIELDGNNSDAWLKLTRAQAAGATPDAAISTCERALQHNPREPGLYVLLGQLHEAKQDWIAARDSYSKALEIDARNPLAANNLAYVLLQIGGDPDAALALAQTARRGMPDSANAADTLGWAYYQKGAFKSAIDLFQEALKLSGKSNTQDNPTLHFHLGLAYLKTGQQVLARQHLEKVLKIDPNYSSAQDVKQALAQLRG